MEKFINMFIGDVVSCKRSFVVRCDVNSFIVYPKDSDDHFTCTTSELQKMLDIL